jgi:peptide/nickel transport system permease protein
MRARLATLSKLEKFAFGVVAILLFLAVFGPLIAPQPTETASPDERLLPPSFAHWFGTDENGTDIFSRVLAAPRVDVVVALVATALSVGIGAPLGAIAGFFEGRGRRVASTMSEGTLRLLDVLQAFPVFILALVLVAIRGTSIVNIVVAVAFVNAPVFLRLARSEVLSLRERPYAEAARAVGNSNMSIAFRHLLPNAMPSLIVQVSVTVGFAILLTAGLSFVGAGVTPPTPELGAMIASGAKYLTLGQWWPALFPGIALGLTVFAFGVVGEALGRLLDPASTRRRTARKVVSPVAPATEASAPAGSAKGGAL